MEAKSGPSESERKIPTTPEIMTEAESHFEKNSQNKLKILAKFANSASNKDALVCASLRGPRWMHLTVR